MWCSKEVDEGGEYKQVSCVVSMWCGGGWGDEMCRRDVVSGVRGRKVCG